jgi:cytochrome c oxidase cbb3-type subunit II
VPEGLRRIPNLFSTTTDGLAHGHKTYQHFYFGCHGPVGDHMGPAQPYLQPPLLNFTILNNQGFRAAFCIIKS